MSIPLRAACGAASVTLALTPGITEAHAADAARTEKIQTQRDPGTDPAGRRPQAAGEQPGTIERHPWTTALQWSLPRKRGKHFQRSPRERGARDVPRIAPRSRPRAEARARSLASLQQAARRKRSQMIAAWDRKADRAIAFALRQRGRPYIWGGTGPRGYDCSGLVQQAWRNAGVKIPRVTYSQFRQIPTHVSRRQLRPGDLLFFNGLGHVGMYLGGNRFIHSPRPGRTVTVERLRGYYRANFSGAARPAWRDLPAIPTS
ncbi:C40 family peptidase [Actinomadura macrotermitis]|uniref:NlpC/P60 domain-containing protein n=1 Tax=Actinomadura macrotermitis TaxID=2585200 RepID=A0A7K0C0Z9_9ACTN|nr:C40 family peptidase [Actinomadura macrotermitis]MQY07070.1 hypothetical protein [Actinomadura macrotermitis]